MNYQRLSRILYTFLPVGIDRKKTAYYADTINDDDNVTCPQAELLHTLQDLHPHQKEELQGGRQASNWHHRPLTPPLPRKY